MEQQRSQSTSDRSDRSALKELQQYDVATMDRMITTNSVRLMKPTHSIGIMLT